MARREVLSARDAAAVQDGHARIAATLDALRVPDEARRANRFGTDVFHLRFVRDDTDVLLLVFDRPTDRAGTQVAYQLRFSHAPVTVMVAATEAALSDDRRVWDRSVGRFVTIVIDD